MNTQIPDVLAELSGRGISNEIIILDWSEDGGDFIPMTKKTVGYIVGAVIFNEHREVLLVQEAKLSCYGKWYLPAGRMEPNETIEQAVQREVTEESGLTFEPSTLLCIQSSRLWHRFTFLGHITGGSLKTVSQGDKESLQASWFRLSVIFSEDSSDFVLRSPDILPLIDLAAKYNSGSLAMHHVLPLTVPHKKMLLRLLLLRTSKDSDFQLLVGVHGRMHLPVASISNVKFTITNFLKKMLRSVNCLPVVHGVLCVEYDGRPAHANDGICITVLVSLDAQEHLLCVADVSRYKWIDVDSTLKSNLLPLIQQNALPLLMQL